MKTMEQNILEWIIENDAKTESGQLMDMKNHAYLVDYLLDDSQWIVCMKAGQVAFTTSSIYKSFYDAQDKRMDIIYTMPSSADSDVLVGGKVNRILMHNDKMFKGSFKSKDTVRQKQIGDNMIYYRGTKNEQQAISVSADAIYVDELDRSDQRIVEMMSSRLQHSKWRQLRLFSNPSFEGNGVHKYWLLSDQKHWFIRCPHCSKEQFLSFPESIDMDRRIYVCKECHGELSPDDRRRGRWRRKYKNRDWSGYWISAMMNPNLDAKFIINEYNTKSAEYFANFVMGLPYVGGDAKLSREDFFKNVVGEGNKQEGKIVIGIDPGIPIWYSIGNQEGVFEVGKTMDEEHFDYLMTRRFKEAIAVIDIGGGGLWPRKMLEKYPGRVFLVQFGTDRKTLQLIQWKEGDESGFVIADRNRMIQLVFDEFRDERLPLCGKPEDFQEMWTHINNVWRTTVVDAQTKNEKYVFESNKPDHLLFTLLYWRVGMDRYGFGGGEIIDPNGDEIEASRGIILSPTSDLDDMEW